MNAQSEESAEEFANRRRALGKPVITELSLRNAAFMLALGCLVSAAVCINKITSVSVSTILHQEWIIYSLTTSLSSEITIDLPMRTQAAAGWIIFLSIVVLFYQTFAVVQMFLYIPLLYMKIPIRKTFWYLFPLIDVGVNIVCIIGYLPVTIAIAVYTYQWIEMLVKIFQEMDSRSRSSGYSDSETQGLIFQQYLLNILVPIIITFTFVLGSTVRFVVMIVFVFLAKFKFKWPNYSVPVDP